MLLCCSKEVNVSENAYEKGQNGKAEKIVLDIVFNSSHCFTPCVSVNLNLVFFCIPHILYIGIIPC
jgi:hypothetical protein